ncbi:hypothetical protein N7468_007762 [Penicillium chermesinum]|uniref:Peptidase C14 caspase domain-containing protein n=1 Tax=Penicillium chermesinum TaxID=63820 RepID=A0A9W9TJ73_9EURO|nr:uncharacterized protein N7468_007762 [Penicillium chermesinum]KAJ5223220.1 hypothetical protein N7468_007762 [Penicillium chermesinum]
MTAISAGQTTNAITRVQFEDAITRTVNNRKRIYNASFALSVRWERDNTDASTDTDNFQAILSTLNLDQAEVMVLSEQDGTPGWTFQDKIRRMFQRATMASGKSIVFVHYAGHGEVRSGQLFAVEGRPNRRINLQRLIDSVVAGDVQDFDIGDTDTVFVLDCCYSHVATRAYDPTTRVVEILAACDDSNPIALTPPRNTLTGKLRGEIARRKHDSHQSVILADVMATIRANSTVVKPTHIVKLGVSICFRFTGVMRIDPSTLAPSLRAVFSVRIVENMTREQLERFLTWIETLPLGYTIELDAVYPTTSTLLIFQSAYTVFVNLAGYPGVTFISEVTSTNRRKYLKQEQRQEDRSSTLKENIPFSRRPKP